MAMIFEDSGDVNKVHSVLEFLLEPDKLDNHLSNLKAKTVVFPSGFDLIRAFLKEAYKENTRDIKRKALLNLVVKVFTTLRPNLDEIEKELNVKVQRQLFECLVSCDHPPRLHFLMRYRWILRGLLKKADPYILFGPSPTKTSISSELLATQQKRTVEEALTFLRQWIKDSQKTIEESELEPVVAFELGEYLLHFESNYDEALQLLTFAKETFNLKQQSKTNSLDVIDTEKLNVDILRCKLFLQRITFDEIQQSSSLWLKIEATKRLHGVSVDIQNQLETLVISSLLLDNLRNELTWDYRYALETQAGFEVIQKKIVCCNILWQALRNDINETIWTRRLNTSNPDVLRFLFSAAVETVKQHSLLAKSLQITLRTPHDIQIRCLEDIHVRLQKLVRNICLSVGKAFCWDILLTNAREFALLPQDEEHLRILTKLERNEGNDLLETILSKSRSTSGSLLLNLNPHLQTHIQDIPLESLFPNLLLERVKKLLVEGENAKSQFIETSYQLLTPLSPTFHPLTSQELTNSQVNIKQWETLLDKIHLLEKEIVVNEQQEKLYNEISLIIANIDVLPTEDILSRFFAQLLNQQQYLVLRKCCAQLRVRFISPNNDSKSSNTIRLEHLLTFWSVFAELCRQLSLSDAMELEDKECSSESQTPEGLLNLFVSFLKTPANVGGKQKIKVIEWKHTEGVLSLLNRNIVQVVIFAVTSALNFLHKTVHNNATQFYSADRFIVQLHNGKSLKTLQFTQSFQMDEKHFQFVLRECLLRLYHLEPPTMKVMESSDDYSTLRRIVNILLSLADVSLAQGSHLLAIRYYLFAGALESKFWTEPIIPDSITQNVKHLIQALIGYKAFTEALVMCQFHNSEADYNTAFNIIQQHFNNLDPFYYNSLWEMPILELLVYVHSKLGEQKTVNQLVSIIGKPEMNESNPPEVRKQHVITMKRTALKQLFREFLNVLPEIQPI